ncbi:MAG: group 1 glycosyl transferase [Lunatimonas sp.]|uniref:group 1 glycosyl transferase n=1 Tax=Lunatimonas sp. TaxID=2060141 RepID=UPI00263BB7FC|nr:group 1 glycosyl transferase [Lunatimonas sp.]MCC5939711.1 group 1 glycosyl transferase [Lunatimonas sp.]
MSNELPKVLILNQPFNSNTGGGITLTNLFSDWDMDKLAVVCPAYLINQSTQTSICSNYYQLGSKEHRWVFPFRVIARKYYSGRVSFRSTSSERVSQVKKSPARVNFIKKYLNPTLEKLGLIHQISSYELSQELKDWIQEYNPDVLYAQAQRRENLLFCFLIQQYLQKPMVFHMMDDWVEWIPKGSILGRNWYRQIDYDFRKVLANTTLHLSISDLMGEEYEKRYGYRFQTFHNPINLEFWKSGQRSSYDLSSSPEILYAGRIGLGISNSLKLMAEAVSFLNHTFGLDLRFVIQSSESEDWMTEFEAVEHRAFVPYEELPMRFGQADILFLPYEFSEESVKFFKYSMPTKASEYMISGTPVLIFSPDEMALVTYAKHYQWARVVTEPSSEALCGALHQLLLQKQERQRLAATAMSIASLRHDGVVVRREFMEQLVQLAKNNP